MRLSVRHVTEYAYEPGAERVALRLRLWPGRFAGQMPGDWTVQVNGAEVVALCRDTWGNPVGLWRSGAALGRIEICASGQVATEDKVGIVDGLRSHPPVGVFLRETALTEATPPLLAFAHGVAGEERLPWLHALCDAVSEAVLYRPSATTPATGAAAALELGAGVCQDQAHLFVASARACGVPARYVVGYLAAEDRVEGAEAEIETHAWAEAFVPDIGWIGFDPTHRRCPTERYVRLTAGLDATDAAPVNGVFSGRAEVAMSARVAIAPDAAPGASRAPSPDQGQDGQAQAQQQGPAQ
ncbi:MAG: transglutaminase family protein [Pseudomonadota bacterium]